jgi:hypothetical protein
MSDIPHQISPYATVTGAQDDAADSTSGPLKQGIQAL